MKKTTLLTGLMLFMLAAPAYAEPSLSQKVNLFSENTMNMELPGGGGAAFKVNIKPVAGANLVYAVPDPESAARLGQTASIFLFDLRGKFVDQVRGFNAASCRQVSMSPNGQVLAVDSGPDHNRTWHFLALPSYKPYPGQLAYSLTAQTEAAPLAWITDNFVVAPILSEPKDRALRCGDKPQCGNLSVNLYNISKNLLMPLFRGTDLCGYYYAGASGRTIYGNKVCVPKVEDWSKPGAASTTRVLGVLPDGQ